jgi:hypothetical protein
MRKIPGEFDIDAFSPTRIV